MTTESTPRDLNRPRVLFVGQDHSSPQIAASLLQRAAGDRVAVETAGTEPAEPGGRSDEMLVAMGLNPADERPLSVRALHTADRVVALGAGLDVARLPGPRYEEWDIDHEDLATRVQALSDDLTTVPDAKPSFVEDWLRKLRGAIRRR
jgi:protein-tyrosine-phosphatase